MLTTLTISDPIAAGSHHDVSWTYEVPSECEMTFNLYAIVDEAGAVDEFDETNNTRMATVPLAAEFTAFDLNYDGLANIYGDIPPLVDCLYREDCNCPEPGCLCPGDCSGDGFFNIYGDVPCFVDCFYNEDCYWQEGRGGGSDNGRGRRSGGIFTIGGAVYADLGAPLMSGLQQVTIEALRVPVPAEKPSPTAAHPATPAATLPETSDHDLERFTATTGSLGIWRIDDLPPGTYVVRPVTPGYAFEHVQAGTPTGRDSVRIVVNEDNRGPNGSIQFMASE